ncbi:hypothetical protein ARMGADRAFT_1027332 [Armillaria gallica]|uniref:Uncharacterized protein n=1 Tax=Armillaria gallica TaxID=47427 RepID=A0A2H3DRU9_ARMGA|nr:hypothetical protein ARMGADRAFT_1027332 [Armillaria gallica]
MAPSMPGPNEKSAPRFESLTDPEELERFFLRLEELFDKSVITMDAEKKKYAVVYTDIKTEKQWKVLEHYAKGTFEEFQKDILSSYDGTLAGNCDAMQEMKQLVCQYRLSPIQERSDYMSFKWEFQVLVAVLKSEDGKPAEILQIPIPWKKLWPVASMCSKSIRELHGVCTSNRSNASVDGAAVKQEDIGGILASMKDIFEQQAQQERQHIAALEKAFVEQQKMITSFLQQQQQQIQAQQYNPYNTHPAQPGFSSAPRQMNAGASLLNRLECWFYSNGARKGTSS